ncbi:molybdopterin molybdotransferase MoeA [Flavobacteriaceae bacterium]|nr:molybdopterin molybdotransferase MoeA [Flavobacteriaceae bacterium]MDB9913837.1 molybdopterin molybdotransferase MoeA [Flavobacteriaceae bacterium]MDC0538895.1 molybdopterin molybdotransferase MoeA [Flavobacteriaceae bacterium]
MISVEEAFELLENNVIPTQISILCKTTNALGLVLAEDVSSPINMPPFRQSAMDGYALNIHNGSSYKIIDEVKAGDGHHPILKIGEAVRIFTGSAVPNTANTVVIQEKVTADKNQLQLNNPVKLKENIRSKGAQIKEGDIALKKGTKLTPAAIGFLLTLGIIEVTVFKKPKIGLVITGNELIKAGQPLSYGKIYESNSGMLYTGLLGLGYTDVTQYKVKDDYNSTVMILDKVISENDMILITGGISVGDYDFVGKALLELGTEQVFYRVKQKPGKPLFFGKIKNKPIFALPGNPASALSNFYVYVHPALEKLSGNLNFSINKGKAFLSDEYLKKGDRAQFLKAYHKNGEVNILEGQSSAMLHTFAIANAIVYIPGEVSKYSKGDLITVLHLPV